MRDLPIFPSFPSPIFWQFGQPFSEGSISRPVGKFGNGLMGMLHWMILPQARRNEIFSLECPNNNQGLSNVFEVEGSFSGRRGTVLKTC